MSDDSLSLFFARAQESYRIAIRDMETADDVIAKGAEKYPIRKIFHDCLPDILNTPIYTAEQKKAAVCIAMCKTPDLGFNASYCPKCDKLFVHYASCNNRNCPCCQNPSQQAWIAQRDNEVIPGIPYYHIILTVPHLLNDLIIANQKELLGALFQCASRAVIDLCQGRKFLGAVPGIVAVLHTWSQQLLPHFHIHMIVSGGGLNALGQFVSLPEKQSKRKKDPGHTGDCFFLPMSALTNLFRGKMMDAVKRLMASGNIRFPKADQDLYTDPLQWKGLCDKLYETKWVGKIVKTFNGNGNAIEYLARYTFKTAICNSRIVSYDGQTVTIRISDRENQSKKDVPMNVRDFIFRFLTHVLPGGFTRVRYAGFLSNSRKNKCLSSIHRQRKLKDYSPSPLVGACKSTIFRILFHTDFSLCSCCGNKLIRFPRDKPNR